MEAFVIYEGSKPWSFGCHAMFSYDDYWFFQRILQCRECELRRLYQRLAAKELSTQKTDGLVCQPLRPRHHFHTITRILKVIKTVDQRIKATRSPLERHKLRSLTCEDHLFDAFDYIFHAADDNIHHLRIPGIGSSPPAKWVNEIFPRGQTVLYYAGLSKFQRASSVNILRDITNSCLAVPIKRESIAVKKANRRWLRAYSDLSSNKVEHREGKRVRFAKGQALVQVRPLIQYARAAQILRKDKTWLFAALCRRRADSVDERMRRTKLGKIFKSSKQPANKEEEEAAEDDNEKLPNICIENEREASDKEESTSEEEEEEDEEEGYTDDSSEENEESKDDDSMEEASDEEDSSGDDSDDDDDEF
ncbi:hypothetical protein Aperf_G00000096014 [Anoplocephala perfoliata]